MTSTPSTVTVRLSSSTASRCVSNPNEMEAARSYVPNSLVRSVTASTSFSPRRMSAVSTVTPGTGFSNKNFRLSSRNSRSQAEILPSPVISKPKAPAESFSWWNPANVFPRPWEDGPEETASVPTEQKRVFAQTRDVCKLLFYPIHILMVLCRSLGNLYHS